MDLAQEVLSDIIVFQKYAKYIMEIARRETWEELCERNMVMHIRKYPQLKEEIKAVYRNFVIPKKVLPSMRSMQFGGRPIELNNTRIFNCSYAPVDHPVFFAEAMQMLLGGCFKEGTLIKTESGDKEIQNITTADKVLTYNEDSKTFTWVHPELAGETLTANKQKVKVTLDDETVIFCTADHKFLTSDGWVEAQFLTDQHTIVSASQTQSISKVELVDDPVNYFDLSIKDTHNFCLANGMVVHNTGVGYSVQQHHVAKLPVIEGPSTRRRKFLVGDSIEGWADAIKVLFKSYSCGKADPDFDYRDIRVKGSQLITAGGKAPGPDPLRICIDQVRAILNRAIGRQLTSLECHDILCHIADAVLSGGIRRAAMIAFFSPDDLDMISCKSGDWWELNPQRGRANNSAVLDRQTITKEQFDSLWERIKNSGSGEPGVYFTNDRDILSNPCVSGDAIISVCDHGVNGGLGLPYYIPMKLLVEMAQGTDLLPCAKSYNETTGELEWKQIQKAWKTKENAQIIRITDTISGKSVKVTPDHKVFTKNRGWVEAQQLQSTDELVFDLTIDAKLIGSNIQSLLLEETEDVFDLTVEDNHNFFADGILVHNCVEATLNAHQFCNLTELNASDITSQEDFNARAIAAAFIGTLQAGYTDFHYLRGVWKDVTEKEALLGVGMTGIASGAVLKLNMPEAAEHVVNENKRVAAIIGINQAARTTLAKPAGGTSLIVGSSSGIHAWHNDYYIRRVRVGKAEPLYKYMLENFPALIEDCKFKPHLDAVMSFPQKAPEDAILRTESALHLLKRVRKVNQEWIAPGHVSGPQKHNVSCTISIKPKEWDMVGEWMWENRNHYNGIAVLPYDGGTYIQAPFENCTKEQYEEMMTHLKGIDLTKVIEQFDNTSHTLEAACAGGKCEI